MNTAEQLKLTPMEFWAFLENSDFQRYDKRGVLYRQDEVNLIQHDTRLDEDYALLTSIGCAGVRDAARWYITHPAPHCFEWAWIDRMVESAGKHGLPLYLDLWHYGYPDWMDILAPDAPQHFAEFAAAIAAKAGRSRRPTARRCRRAVRRARRQCGLRSGAAGVRNARAGRKNKACDRRRGCEAVLFLMRPARARYMSAKLIRKKLAP